MRLILSEKDVRILEHSPAPVEQILLEQGINPLDVIVSRNGKLLPEDTVIQRSDEVQYYQDSTRGIMFLETEESATKRAAMFFCKEPCSCIPAISQSSLLRDSFHC